MKARVAGATKVAAEPVRAILPARFTIIGHAVSVNDYHVPVILGGKPAKRKTKEALEWDKLSGDQMKAQWGIMAPVTVEVFLTVDVFLSANRMDEDNPLKPLQDQLQASKVLANDRLVRRATITKHVDRNRPRVEIWIYESTLTPL